MGQHYYEWEKCEWESKGQRMLFRVICFTPWRHIGKGCFGHPACCASRIFAIQSFEAGEEQERKQDQKFIHNLVRFAPTLPRSRSPIIARKWYIYLYALSELLFSYFNTQCESYRLGLLTSDTVSMPKPSFLALARPACWVDHTTLVFNKGPVRRRRSLWNPRGSISQRVTAAQITRSTLNLIYVAIWYGL